MPRAHLGPGDLTCTRSIWFVQRACEHKAKEACNFLTEHVRAPAENEEALALRGQPMDIDREMLGKRHKGTSGQLLLHAVTSPEGRVVNPRALQQENAAAEWATSEVARKMFHPGTLCGEPVAFNHLFVLEFYPTPVDHT